MGCLFFWLGHVFSICDDMLLNYYNCRYVNLKACIARLPEQGYGSNVTTWPVRLQNPPDRLQTVQIDAYISRRELFKAESKYWKEIIQGYVRALHWKQYKFRNVLDMRAGFGGYLFLLTFFSFSLFFFFSLWDSFVNFVFYFGVLSLLLLLFTFWQICSCINWESTGLLGDECCSC